MAKPPFDPIKGAWLLLCFLVAVVALGQAYIFVGCLFGSQPLCSRATDNLTSVSVEVLAAVALLIGLGRKP